jgi:hypothetical protein
MAAPNYLFQIINIVIKDIKIMQELSPISLQPFIRNLLKVVKYHDQSDLTWNNLTCVQLSMDAPLQKTRLKRLKPIRKKSVKSISIRGTSLSPEDAEIQRLERLLGVKGKGYSY